MRWIVFWVALLPLSACAQLPDFTALVRGSSSRRPRGSGFIVGSDGYVVTNLHVVDEAWSDVAMNPGTSGGPLFNLRARSSASTPSSSATPAPPSACLLRCLSTRPWKSWSNCAGTEARGAGAWACAYRKSRPGDIILAVNGRSTLRIP